MARAIAMAMVMTMPVVEQGQGEGSQSAHQAMPRVAGDAHLETIACENWVSVGAK